VHRVRTNVRSCIEVSQDDPFDALPSKGALRVSVSVLAYTEKKFLVENERIGIHELNLSKF